VFLENAKMDFRQVFSWFRRKHLFITTCIEKQCTRPLNRPKTFFLVSKAIFHNFHR